MTGETSVVFAGGRMGEISFPKSDWKLKGRAIENAKPKEPARSMLGLGIGDFEVSLRMSVHELKRGQPALRFSEGAIVFLRVGKRVRVRLDGGFFHGEGGGKKFTESEPAGLSSDPFQLLFRREEDQIIVQIDETVIHTQRVPLTPIGKLTLAPGEARIKISEWRLRGSLGKSDGSLRREISAIQDRIDDAIDAGVEHILKTQNRDGSWTQETFRYRNGSTALAAYTLLKAGLAFTHPAVERAFAYLDRSDPRETYAVGCQMMAYQLSPKPKHKEKMKKMLADLLAWQKGDWGYPHRHVAEGFDYGTMTRPDLSNTQYAALGLRAARLAGIHVPRKVWIALVEETLRYQGRVRRVDVRRHRKRGSRTGRMSVAGFSYIKGAQGFTGSMTTAGIGVLAICREGLGQRAGKRVSRMIDDAIEAGLNWLDLEFRVDRNINKGDWKLYYLYGLERVGSLLGIERVGRHPWYLDGARELIDTQKKDSGAWDRPEKAVQSCFAVLFLKRSTRIGGKATSSKARVRNRKEADDPKFPVRLLANGDASLELWVRGFHEKAVAKVAEGASIEKMRVVKIEYLVDGNLAESFEGHPTELWHKQRFPYRHEFDRIGEHIVEAVVHARFDADPKSKTVMLVSPAMKLDVVSAREKWMDRAEDPSTWNRVAGARPEVTTSTHLGQNSQGFFAVDGAEGTAWLCSREDSQAVIKLSFRKAVRANALILNQVAANVLSLGSYDQIKRVSVRVNRMKKAQIYELATDTIRPQSLELPSSRIKRLVITILERKQGSQHGGVAGFSEIQLEEKR